MLVYGYVNGNPVYSHEEFVCTKRGFGPIETDAELMAYAEKVTHGWSNAGWKQTFVGYYLSDYALAEQSYGTWLLLLIAVGFAAYGLFAVSEARYRKV